jgi:hypothetical protein
MKTAEKIKGIPLSGEYEEIIFDLPEPWREDSWNYVKFTTTDWIDWCGVFRQYQGSNFLLGVLPEKGIACVVSGGHAYIIDIDNKEKIKDIKFDVIIDLYADKQTNTFYISSWWDVVKIDDKLNEIQVPVPLECDGIFFKETNERTLKLEIEEIGMEHNKNLDYSIDLNEGRIIKNDL